MGPARLGPHETGGYSAPGSLLGLLQRGRGAGYLLALREPPEVVRPLLLRCLTEGPFPDSDPRGGYLARLILHAGLELEPVAAFLRERDTNEPDSPVRLALDTLAAAAVLGSEEALGILRDYVEWGFDWDGVLTDLSERQRQDLFSGWGDAVIPRCEAETPQGLAIRLSVVGGEEEEEPWPTWRRSPAVDQGLKGYWGDGPAPSVKDKLYPDPELERLPFEELFELMATGSVSGGCPYLIARGFDAETRRELRILRAGHLLFDSVRVEHRGLLHSHLNGADADRCLLALRCLRWSKDAGSVAVLRTFLESNPELPLRIRYATVEALSAQLGEAALRLGREWLQDSNPDFRRIAADALERQATEEDLPQIRAAAIRALEAGEERTLRTLLGAFRRFPGIGRVPELERVYTDAAAPNVRHCVVDALATAAPDHFARQIAPEALWDASVLVQATAARVVPLRLPGVIDRLREMRQDPLSDQDTRDAAAQRLSESQEEKRDGSRPLVG